MGKIAASLLTLFCAIMLSVLVPSAVALISGKSTFGGGGMPIEYASFIAIFLFAGYGFYAGCRALLVRKPRLTGDGTQSLPRGDFQPIRTIGWVLVIFGCLGLYALAEIYVANPSTPPINFLVIGRRLFFAGRFGARLPLSTPHLAHFPLVHPTTIRVMNAHRRDVLKAIATISLIHSSEAQRSDPMYGLIGKITATAGQRDSLIAILLEGTHDMPGCLSYIIAKDASDEDSLWITEVWDSKSSHDASLALPAVKSSIAKGRPLIAAFGTPSVTAPVGGHGLASKSKP